MSGLLDKLLTPEQIAERFGATAFRSLTHRLSRRLSAMATRRKMARRPLDASYKESAKTL
ncbi:hypothetical protein AJ87_14600 [Rhizobium yanglingense]|nr:hypothetical protein AJ87_14600 [Rhizobium yanglingense]